MLVKVVKAILLAPFALAGGLLFLALWLLLTISGIGPLLHYSMGTKDKKLIDTVRASGEYQYFKTSRGYVLAYRLLRAQDAPPQSGQDSQLPAALARLLHNRSPKKHPIVIPGGLAATMFTTNKMQDLLHAAGFTVLAYDRLGVGLSDPNETGAVPTVESVLEDMKTLMDHTVPDAPQWLFLGPSMGSIVCQAFMATYPQICIGFLNLDGFPHPFAARREKFRSYGKVYAFMTKIHWTGIVRFGMCFMKSMVVQFTSHTTSETQIIAQMNQKRFLSNVAVEMTLMIDLADVVSAAWGDLSLLRMDPQDLMTVLCLPPTVNGQMDPASGEWVTLPRSKNERGSGWLDLQNPQVANDLATLRAKRAHSKLGQVFEKLVVRVLGARAYVDSEFDDDMKNWNGAEHALHQYMARDGKRFIFPELDHSKLFLRYPEIVLCLLEIDSVLRVDGDVMSR